MRPRLKAAAVLFAVCLALPSSPSLADPVDYQNLLNRPRPTPTGRIAYGDAPSQFGELWVPRGTGPYPVVVMIHGGCWQKALPGLELMTYLADDLRKSNVAVWNLEYRRLGEKGGGYPGTFLDIAQGIEVLRQIASGYNLDLTRTVFLGHSAGGHLALWAAGRHNISDQSPLHGSGLAPRAVMTLAGIDDLKSYRDHGPGACGEPPVIDRLIAAKDHPGDDDFRDTSPVGLLPIGVQQIVVSGSEDLIVDPRFGSDYATLARAAGDTVDVLEIRGAGHFELIDPTSHAWAQTKASLLKNLR